jgi:hypothetical protein
MDDFAKDIAAKARWAIVHNDGFPKPAWSTGERLAVALVCDDPEALKREDFTVEQALRRLAGDIGGTTADAERWVGEVQATL